MKLNKGLLGIFASIALFAPHVSLAADAPTNVCQSTETAQDKIARTRAYAKNQATCTPGTVVKYISPVRYSTTVDGKAGELPCFQMHYLGDPSDPKNPLNGRAVLEVCDPTDVSGGPGG
jgi:hypothetical protein